MGADDRSALELAEASEWGVLYRMITDRPDRAEECDDFGMMPLHWACTARDVQPRLVRKLVDAYPLAIVLKNKGGLVPLHIAIKAKVPLEVVQILVNKNQESVCEETPTGETAAELAHMLGLSNEVITFLSDTEDEMRASGKMPPRPTRFHLLDAGPSPSGNNAHSNDKVNRNNVNGLRAYGAPGGLTLHALPPRWKLDKKCNICLLKFSYFKSRHHCRNCGVSVCSTHSNKRLPLSHFGLDTPQRVCLMCYDEFVENGKPSAVANIYGSKKTTGDHKSGDGSVENLDSVHSRQPLAEVTHGVSDRRQHPLSHSMITTSMTLPTKSTTRLDDGRNDEDVENRTWRSRAQTETTPDDIDTMKEQVKELQTHVRELKEYKERMRSAVEQTRLQQQQTLQQEFSLEKYIGDIRSEDLIDISRIQLDEVDAKEEVRMSQEDDEVDEDVCEFEMPNSSSLNVAATCNYLGLAYWEKGDYASAIDEFRKASEMNSNDADVWYNLARALHSTEEHEEAETAVRRALELRPTNYSVMSLLGTILHSRGEHDKSIDVFRSALGLMTTPSSESDDEEEVGSMTVGW